MTCLDEKSGSVPVRIDRRYLMQIAGLAGLASVGVARLGDRILAQEGATPPVVPQLPANISLIADGLENPQYLAIAADGTIFISETGAFETDTIVASPVAGTPAPAGAATVHGETGLVSSVTPDGTRTVIVGGLPSYLSASGADGPAGLALVDGSVLVVIGGAAAAISEVTPYPNENSLLRIDLATGVATNLANIGAYETENNPDGFAISSNCRGLAVVDGIAWVSDAGGNTIYAIDLAAGEVRPLAVIPGIPATEPNPERQGLNEIDPVPSGLAVAPDGTLLVGFVGAAPVTSGSSGILKVAPDGTVMNWAGGLMNIVAMAIAPDGTVYASQLSADPISSPPATGSIVRLSVDGASELVIEGLDMPRGLAFDAAGDLHVVVRSFGSANGGVVVRITDPSSQTSVALATPVPPAIATPVTEVTSPVVVIEAQDMAFAAREVEMPAAVDVTLTVRNTGFIPHDFRIDSPLIQSGIIAGNAEVSLVVNLPAGSYTFYCTVRGHKQAGMIGVLRAV